MKYSKILVNSINIFYRTAGNPDKPAMILFHGFPSASHMFRDLMPMLQDKFYLIAPDYPGFGQSDMPQREKFNYSFDNIANVMNEFIFDYGAPIGFRIALKNPEKILGIISQNGNIYQERLGQK